MADKETTTEPNEIEADEPQGGIVKAILRKAKVISIVLVIVALECGLAYSFLPDATDTLAMAARQQAIESGEAVDGEAEGSEDEQSIETTQEIEVGKGFSVSAFQPGSGTTLRIDFSLWGIVAKEDAADFQEQLLASEKRIREQVVIAVRSASINDLSDAGLGLIKRKILDKTNRLLGKPYLKSVIFSDYSFIEQ